MEKNKIYNIEEYPLEVLTPGTIIRVVRAMRDHDTLQNDLVLICERGGLWADNNDDLLAISIKCGEFYTKGNAIETYEIVKI